MFKKGDKVVRVLGRGLRGMRYGDMGTVSKNQIYPGVVELEEFGGDQEAHRLVKINEQCPHLYTKKFIESASKHFPEDWSASVLQLLTSMYIAGFEDAKRKHKND